MGRDGKDHRRLPRRRGPYDMGQVLIRRENRNFYFQRPGVYPGAQGFSVDLRDEEREKKGMVRSPRRQLQEPLSSTKSLFTLSFHHQAMISGD